MGNVNDLLAQLISSSGQAVADKAPAVIQGAANNTPSVMGILSSLVQNSGSGSAGTTAMPVSDKGVGINDKQLFDPAQEGTAKALKDFYNKTATEALHNNVPAGHVMDQVGIANNASAPQTQEPTSVAPPAISPGSLVTTDNYEHHQDPHESHLAGIMKGFILGQKSTFDPTTGSYTPPHMGVMDALFPGYSSALKEKQAYAGALGAGMGAVPGQVAEAVKVPLNAAQTWEKEYQQKSLAATGYSSQITLINDELSKVEEAKKNITEQIKAAAQFRGPLAKFTGGKNQEISALYKQLNGSQGKDGKVSGGLNQYESLLHQKLVGLVGNQPNKLPDQGGKGFQTTPSGNKFKLKG